MIEESTAGNPDPIASRGPSGIPSKLEQERNKSAQFNQSWGTFVPSRENHAVAIRDVLKGFQDAFFFSLFRPLDQ